MDDAELLQKLVEGDERAFVEVVTRYHLMLVRVARYYVNSDASAEDVAQETWIAVLRGVNRFEGRSSFKTWLLRILVNRARSTGVKEHRVVPSDLLTSERSVSASRFDQGGLWTDPPVPFTEKIDDGIVNGPIVQLVHDCIGRLPASTRAVVTLRDVEGLSTAEVAELLDLTEANVRVILHRCRARIRSEVEATMRVDRS
ncbi:MAG TPA: RNA polymerase sigma factor [Acidimicrobiales bacterium]|nr:RNA polymerase sigma factor [Acidimicrobiales bacterium]